MSFGVSTLANLARGTPVATTLQAVLEAADAALYHAKEGG
jgi:PleD family two-component response regulator